MGYKRLIYFGGARETNSDGSMRRIGVNDNSAFKFAAQNVSKSYLGFNDQIILKKIDSARKITQEINSQNSNSIRSLDILSHGSPLSLNFSKNSYESCGFYVGWLGKQAIIRYYSDDEGVYKFTVDAQSVSDIDFSKFTEDARIQLHGCLTASDWFRTANGAKVFPVLVDNIAEELSEQLYAAGKKKSFVIGHSTRGNPNINGNVTSIDSQDYRHGHRVVYNNGNVLFKTTQTGHLKDAMINSKFSQ